MDPKNKKGDKKQKQKTDTLRRNGNSRDSMDPVLREKESLWWKGFVRQVSRFKAAERQGVHSDGRGCFKSHTQTCVRQRSRQFVAHPGSILTSRRLPYCPCWRWISLHTITCTPLQQPMYKQSCLGKLLHDFLPTAIPVTESSVSKHWTAIWLTAWHSGSDIWPSIKVTLRMAWLVLGWVTVFRWVYHIGM